MATGIRVIPARPRAVRRRRPTLSSSRELYGRSVQRSARATSCTAEASNAQLKRRAVRRKRPTLSSSRELYGGSVQRSARAASCTAEPSNAQLEPRAVRRKRLARDARDHQSGHWRAGPRLARELHILPEWARSGSPSDSIEAISAR